MTSASSSSVDDSRTRCVHMPPAGLQPARGLHALEVQPDLEPPARAWTHGAELLRATQAHVGLLWRELDIGAEALHDSMT